MIYYGRDLILDRWTEMLQEVTDSSLPESGSEKKYLCELHSNKNSFKLLTKAEMQRDGQQKMTSEQFIAITDELRNREAVNPDVSANAFNGKMLQIGVFYEGLVGARNKKYEETSVLRNVAYVISIIFSFVLIGLYPLWQLYQTGTAFDDKNKKLLDYADNLESQSKETVQKEREAYLSTLRNPKFEEEARRIVTQHGRSDIVISEKQNLIQGRFDENYKPFNPLEREIKEREEKEESQYSRLFVEDANRGVNYSRKDTYLRIDDRNPFFLKNPKISKEDALQAQAKPLRDLILKSPSQIGQTEEDTIFRLGHTVDVENANKRWEIPLQLAATQIALVEIMGNLLTSIGSELVKNKWSKDNQEFSLVARFADRLPTIHMEVHRDKEFYHNSREGHIDSVVVSATGIIDIVQTTNKLDVLVDKVQTVIAGAVECSFKYTLKLEDKTGRPIISDLSCNIKTASDESEKKERADGL